MSFAASWWNAWMRRATALGCAALCAAWTGADTGTSARAADALAAIDAEGYADDYPGGRWSGREAEMLAAPLALKQRATIQLGGEAYVDLSYKTRDAARNLTPPFAWPGNLTRTGFEATNANLRFHVTPMSLDSMRLIMKLNLSDAWNDNGRVDQDDLLEECRFVFDDVGGSGWSLMFGKGEVPFGQDRTLGIIQSYAHNADAYASSEGPISLLADPPWYAGAAGRPVGVGGLSDALARPGEIDRAFFAGASFRWRDMLKAEFAVFQNPEGRDAHGRHTSDGLQSFAARLWWTPIENLTVQLSGVRRHDCGEGDASRGKRAGYAVSAGVEWTPGPWEFWTEYIHGWNWNHRKGYSSDMLSLGGRYAFTPSWSMGLMGEFLRLRDGGAGVRREDYYKLVFSVKYTMESGLFLIGEVGKEWFRGRYHDTMWNGSANATIFALRAGWQF